MIGNGNSVKKTTTNFTIECILSKEDRKENGDLSRTNSNNHNHMHHQSHHPLTLNKVLDNPWIPKTPLALSFNPSSYHRKLNFSNIPLPPTYEYLPSTPPLALTPPILQSGSNYIQNLVKTTQHHTSVHNHFYSVASNEASATSQQHQLQQIKNYSIINNTHPAILSSPSSPSSLSLEKDLKLSKMNVYDCNKLCDTQLLSEDLKKVVDNKNSLLSINEIKCSICSKFFDNSELMDVS